MKGITKKIVTVFMAGAMMAMTAMTAMASSHTVEMFGETEDGYVFSDHSGKMIDNVKVNDEGDYVVTFKEVSMGAITGYISAIETADGFEGELDGTTMTLTFSPEGAEFAGLYKQDDGTYKSVDKVGTMITYTVTLSTGTHSTSDGAIVIE